MIAYDPSLDALISPELRETLFLAGQAYSPSQLAMEAARLAYVRTEASEAERERLAHALGLVGFDPPQRFDAPLGGAHAFGAFRPSDGTALVAFRGTQIDDPRDLLADLQAVMVPWAASAGRVHAGFAATALSLMPAIETWLAREAGARRQLILSGHSLGAAMATLAASAWHPTLLVTLGSPLVGDAAFAATVAPLTSERIVNCCDLVTRVPPALPFVAEYVHVALRLYVDRAGVVHAQIGDEAIDGDRAEARAAFTSGQVPARDFADHAPINYLRAFFP